MDADGLLERVRAVALGLPAVSEKVSHGAPGWFVAVTPSRSPQLASFDDHHHGADHVALVCAAPDGAQAELVSRDPRVWFVPPYVGGRGWVGTRLDADTDWAAVEDLLDDAWRTVVPSRMHPLLDP